MALIVKTRYPEELVTQIRKRIDSQEIDSWLYDADGDFTSSSLWENHAWFRPYIETDYLIFAIIGRKDTSLTYKEYAFYHGNFTEMLMDYFSHDITEIRVQSPFVNDKDTKKIERQ